MSDITFLARTNFRKKDQVFGIKRADRRQHTYVVGKTGVGKSAFLKNMALQDIQNGEGLAIIDPHGELVEDMLKGIPEERMNDVVYFNPSDMEFPVSFNIMEVQDPKYKHLIASGLIGIFTKIWANVWSARMEYILANCILALLDTPGTTLLGIPRMLVDRDYRQKIVNNLKDPVVKSFWVNEYEEWSPTYRNEAIAPVQNKVGQFLNVSLIRNIVGQAKNTIDVDDIMNSGKILLVNVSKGRIGEDNSAILGAMIITKIQLAAMERVRIPEDDRKDFYLYVDEFQNFATDSFVNILSEARKYRLNLVIAHQYIGQLVTETTTAVRDAVFGNVGTMVCFRVGATDAEFLELEFTPEFEQNDLIHLPNYNIYIKLMIDGITSRPFSAKTIAPPSVDKESRKRDQIIEVARRKYAKSKETVEDEITRWAGGAGFEDALVNPEAPRQAKSQGRPQQQYQSSPGATTLYDAKCSNCGKHTKVIFPPEPGKPVYCKSCLKKMKRPDKSQRHFDGPATIPPKADLGEGGEKKSSLAAMGIEFNSPRSNNQKPEESGSITFKPFKQTSRNQSFNQRQPKKEINLSELKKAIDESLEKDKKEVHPPLHKATTDKKENIKSEEGKFDH